MWLSTLMLALQGAVAPLPLTDVVFLEQPPAHTALPEGWRRTPQVRVTIRCRVGADGWLRDCQAIEAEGDSAGWSLWAARRAAAYRVAPQDAAGQPTAGRPVEFAFGWGFDRP